MEERPMTKGGAKIGATARAAKAKLAPAKKRSFAPDRKGESSAGAMGKDKKRSVAASRDGSNTR
jgi:hypothetical protein